MLLIALAIATRDAVRYTFGDKEIDMANTSVKIKVSKDVYLRLKDFVSERRLSKSMVASNAITKYLDELESLEDKIDAQEAEKAWLDFVASGEKAIPAEKVYKKLRI